MGTTDPGELLDPDLTTAMVRFPVDRHPVDVYLASLSTGSRRSMLQALNRVAAIASGSTLPAAEFPWPMLRYQHTAAIRARLAETSAPSTANRILAALRGVLKECWRLGYTSAEDYHKAADLENVRGQRLPAGRMLSSEEIAVLFRSCALEGTAGARLDAALLALLLGCGLRRSEAVGLDLADYEAEDQTLRVRRGKGHRERLVPIVNGQRAALDAWLFVRGMEAGSLLCPVSKSGQIDLRRMTTQAIYMRLAKRAEKAGTRAFSPHDLRRTFISSLLDHGADISSVQHLVGHANVATTTRYDRRGEKAKRKAAELLHVPFVALPPRLQP